MHILGIESSCDDTSVALVSGTPDGFAILSEKTKSQIDIHKRYGGVVPEIAGRYHAEAILPLIEEVLDGQPRPDAIAVTSGPGLITGLLIGVEAAKSLSYLTGIPLVRTNHIAGHIHSVELANAMPSNPHNAGPHVTAGPIRFPALALVVSGGHTEIMYMKEQGHYQKIGRTRDDAAGECFDKAAKLLGLEYPGGPKISKLAISGRTDAIAFPRPMIDTDNYDFSFAGLKTSVLYWLRDNATLDTNSYQLTATSLSDFSASFEQAIVDVLVTKTVRAIREYQPQSVLLVGGVSANKKLRDDLGAAVQKESSDIIYRLSPLSHAMDNGAMIAAAGYYEALHHRFTPWSELLADPNWELGE